MPHVSAPVIEKLCSLGSKRMFWEVMFWASALLLIVPLPFKLAALYRDKDNRPKSVIAEEFVNVLFMSLGLIAFWQYIYSNRTADYPLIWYCWLFIAVCWSIVAIFKSAKLDYAKEQIGKKATIILSSLSTVFFLPMFIAVFNYAG